MPTNSLPQEVVISLLNRFQSLLDTFVIPLVSEDELRPYLPEAESALLDFVLHDLQPNDAHLSKITIMSTDVAHLQIPTNATAYQQRFVRVSPTGNQAFDAMATQLLQDTGQRIIIVSGYRSPTYQALLLLKTYYQQGFNIQKTLRQILPPGYSGHQNAAKPAIDISNAQGELPAADFERTIYPWLNEHAAEFGFTEPYHQQQSGMVWEPWHWQLG